MNAIDLSQHVSKHPFFNGVVEAEDYSFCVFASKYIMDLIEQHIDADSRQYLFGGTFKVVPVSM